MAKSDNNTTSGNNAASLSRTGLEQSVRQRANQDAAFRTALKDNPHAVLLRDYKDWFAEGKIPEGKTIKVIEEDENTLYLVLPPSSHFPHEVSGELLESVQGGVGLGKGLTKLKGNLHPGWKKKDPDPDHNPNNSTKNGCTDSGYNYCNSQYC